jgi:hypothetical protein
MRQCLSEYLVPLLVLVLLTYETPSVYLARFGSGQKSREQFPVINFRSANQPRDFDGSRPLIGGLETLAGATLPFAASARLPGAAWYTLSANRSRIKLLVVFGLADPVYTR